MYNLLYSEWRERERGKMGKNEYDTREGGLRRDRRKLVGNVRNKGGGCKGLVLTCAGGVRVYG